MTQRGRIEFAAARRAPQHRLHRQLGRREHLRPGGQHQDRAGAGGALGSTDDRRPQYAADRDDRGRGGGLAAQQLPAVAGAQPGRAPQRARSARLCAADACARGARPARSPARGAAVRRGAAGAGPRRAGPDTAGAGGAAELRQDRAVSRTSWTAGCRTSRSSRAGSPPISRRCCASASPATSRSTACAARSLPLGLTNAIVNRGGPAHGGADDGRDRAGKADVAHAFMAAREVFELPQLWQRIDALDGRLAGRGAAARSTRRPRSWCGPQTLWFLHDGTAIGDLAGTIARHKAGLAALKPAIEERAAGAAKDHIGRGRAAARRRRHSGRPGRRCRPAGGAGHLRRPSPRSRQRRASRCLRAARVFLEIGEHLRIRDLVAKAAAIAALGSLRPACHRPGASVSWRRRRRHSRAMPSRGDGARHGASGRAERLGPRLQRSRRRWSRTGPYAAHHRAASGGGRPAQRAGGAGRSFSISQHGPSERVLPDPQPAKACPLVSPRGSLVPDRHHGRSRRPPGVVANTSSTSSASAALSGAAAAMLGRGDEQIDVPGAGRQAVGLLLAPQADLDGVRVADRLAAALDDAGQRGRAAHGQRDLGLRARRIAPPGSAPRVGQPAAHEEAILGQRRAEMNCGLSRR